MDKKSRSFRNEKIKAYRASEVSEEQSKERLSIIVLLSFGILKHSADCGKALQRLGGPINESVDLNMMFCACECLCTAYPFESEVCISGLNHMCQPSIESATALSDVTKKK